MGIFSALRLTKARTGLALENVNQIVSPWSDSSHLQSVVLSDIFGTKDLLPVTRAEAMRVPSIAKARSLICGTAMKLPLIAGRDGMKLTEQPTFLYRTNSQVSPQQRLLWTLDDLIFHGWSLWAVERGTSNQIMDAVRVPSEWWKFEPDGTVKVKPSENEDYEEVANNDVILISGPQEGLLEIGERAIRQYQDLEETRASRLRNPVASIVIQAQEEINLTHEEIQDLVDDYADSHKSSSLSVSYMPHNVKLEEHGTASPELFLQMENAINVQIAQMTNVPATLLDASIEGSSSLTYQNSGTERSWFQETTLAYWLTAIESRLSLDDVVPRGQYVQFDLTSLSTIPIESARVQD